MSSVLRNLFYIMMSLFMTLPMSFASTSLGDVAATSSVSQLKKNSPPHFLSNLELSFRGLMNENHFSKANTFDLTINYFLTYNVNPYIFFKLNPLAQMQSGHVQSIDANEKLENKISILNAAVYTTWMKESYFALGILNSSQTYSPLLVSEKGFFSTQVYQSLYFDLWQLSAQIQAAIPNSESSVSDQNQKESTPFLSSVGFSSNWHRSSKNFAYLALNYFKYSSIPTSISTVSVESGNTGDTFKISETERSFKYDYEGIDSQFKFTREVLSNLYLLGSGGFIVNEKAPDEMNKATLIGGGLGYKIGRNLELEAESSYYKIEPDAVLAYYANSRFFRTNHQGIELSTSLLLKKEKFKISFYYNDSKLVYENPNQSDEKLYFIKFEVLHVAI
ncbi:MAG: hypothetical protein J0M15_05665 [Deltaproteobacteria bacterium]|nr:hypothetical protein [Deltaproteobacteria bacterium]